MNKLYTSLLVLLALASCSKDPAETPEPEQYLKSTTAYMKLYSGGQPDQPSRMFKWSGETYTSNGLVSEKEYHEDHDLDGPCYWLAKESNTYEHGVLKERKVLSPRANTTQYSYSYSNGRLIEMEEYGNSGDLYTTYKYEYNGGEFPSRMLQYFPGQTDPYRTHTYTYDGKGKVLKEHSVYFNGVESTIERVYDEKGNLTKETLKMGEYPAYIRKLIKYSYDAKGRIAEREFSTWLDTDFQKWVYHYYEEEPSRVKAFTDKVKSIDVYKETVANSRVYELIGDITYDYDFRIR